ncbi:adenosine monophosphate transferase FICD like [Fusarium beomiforme]|uniref:Adenosine monophosphate transferase FICD like n=1 Tax=Fusarium beomiforme TaxID=44412 RepID=A0A9P5AD96_9HYPO|nr:adenosine monophosphate transferase FICD like [Fusarium beomiforme]
MAPRRPQNANGASPSTHQAAIDQKTHRLAITMDESSYVDIDPGSDPRKLYQIFRELSLERTIDPEIMQRHLIDSTYRLVHGSNNIESGNYSQNITIELCRAIFEGLINDPSDLLVLSVDSYKEIAQHIKAAQYLFVQMMKSDLSEDIIKETHRILTNELNRNDGTPETINSGRYRQAAYWTTSLEYMDEKKVAPSMKGMIVRYKVDVLKAKRKGQIDPISLAAKYSHIFFSIRPFLSGNGQMSRLILNAILFKWAGCLATFGQDVKDCNQYLLMVTGTIDKEFVQDHGEWKDLSDDKRPKLYNQLASFTLKHAVDNLMQVYEPQV